MKTFIEWTFNHRKWITATFFIITVICGYSFLGLRIDNSIETLTVDDDPALLALQRMEKVFGRDEFIVISFKDDDIFDPAVLTMIERPTKKIDRKFFFCLYHHFRYDDCCFPVI